MKEVTIAEDQYASTNVDTLTLERMSGGNAYTTLSKGMFSGKGDAYKRLRAIVLNTIDMYDVRDYMDLNPYVDRVLVQIINMVPEPDQPYLFRMTSEVDCNGKVGGTKFTFTFEFYEPSEKLGARAPTAQLLSIGMAYL